MTDGKPRRAHRSAEQMLVELKQRLREINDLNAAASVLNWDQATYMPQAGVGARGRQLAMAFRINCYMARSSSLAWPQQFEIGLKALEKLKASKSGNALYSRRLRSCRSWRQSKSLPYKSLANERVVGFGTDTSPRD